MNNSGENASLAALGPASALQLSAQLGRVAGAKGLQLTTAESCTGGAIAAAITATAGSSAWFECGIVSYANSVKHRLLGVALETLAQQGAVSQAVVQEMAKGALALSGADIAVAVSGIAGPSGGSEDKPVGTVWFAWLSAQGHAEVRCHRFEGDRLAVQRQAVVCGLDGLLRISERY